MFQGELRDFQEEAVRKMLAREEMLVAAVMGAGKTVITIAALEELFEDGQVERGMVIVPAALKYQWRKQLSKFTDASRVLVIDGTPSERATQWARAPRFEYVIINYKQLLNDWEDVQGLLAVSDFVVCDEVQAIKNFRAQRTEKVKQLDTRFKFGLTGTAVENKPEEVFSIMEWVDPDVLGNFRTFDRTFVKRNKWGGVERYVNLPLFHRTLGPAMSRYSYDDIADQLPRVAPPHPITIPFHRDGRKLYRSITEDLQHELGMAGASARNWTLEAHYSSDNQATAAELAQRGRIMSRITCLRMLCGHPRLLWESAHKFGDPNEDAGSQYAAELLDRGLLKPDIRATKYTRVIAEILSVLAEDPRNQVVVFSTFLDTLDWMQDDLAEDDVFAVVHTGRQSSEEKEELRETFRTDPKCRVFLSSEAGGVGVDLPNANYLMNYDLPWSAGQLRQRNARIRRISSEFDLIHVIDFLMEDSIEMRQYDVLAKRMALADAIMDGKGEAEIDMEELGTLSDFINLMDE